LKQSWRLPGCGERSGTTPPRWVRRSCLSSIDREAPCAAVASRRDGHKSVQRRQLASRTSDW
jgi:hypothetical protein